MPLFACFWSKTLAKKTTGKIIYKIKTGNLRHKKALYDKFSEVKVVYKTPRKDYIFSNFVSFKKFLSFKHSKICGLISPRAVSDSVNISKVS